MTTTALDTVHATCRYGPHAIRRGVLSTDGPWYADVLGGGDGIDCDRSPTGLHAPADGVPEVELLRTEVARLAGVVEERSAALGLALHREEFCKGQHAVTRERLTDAEREIARLRAELAARDSK